MLKVVVPEIAEKLLGLVVELGFAQRLVEDGPVVGLAEVGGDVDVEDPEAV